MSRRILPNLQPSPGHFPPPGPPDPGPSKPTYARRGKITIVACVPCRKRKTKCDGKRPSCGQCSNRDGECTYDMTDEQRKLTYLREHSEILQQKQQTLEQLLELLQQAPEDIAHSIFERLRSGESPLQVAEHFQAGAALYNVARQQRSSEPSVAPSSGTFSPRSNLSRLQDYERLMEILQTANTAFSGEILARIRARQDVSTILDSMDKGKDHLASSVYMDGSSSEPDAGDPIGRLESNWEHDRGFGLLRDPNSTIVDPSGSDGYEEDEDSEDQEGPWTTVTQDGELVQHLLLLYFTWQHAFFQNFPEKLFRRDMENRKTKYCSSSLVNALCATGCYLSSRERLQRDRMGTQSISRAFAKEAVRDLNRLKKPTIPSIAATYLISYVEGFRGDTSNQWIFGGRSTLMALDLGLHLEPADEHEALRNPHNEQERDDELLARSHAFWGCFHVMQLNSFTLGRLPLCTAQSIEISLPEVDAVYDAEPWEAYEMSLIQRVGARSTVFNQCASLSAIINSTLNMFYAPVDRLTAARLVEEYDRYREWYNTLPEIVSSTEQAPPHVLCLHLYYHSAVLLLWRPFLKATVENSDIVPRDICREAADAISRIWIHHRSMFGMSGVWQFQVNCLLIASTIHVINMPAVSAIANFMEACTMFQDLVAWHGWAKASLNTIRSLVSKWKIILPPQCEELLYRDVQKFSEAESWRSQRQSSHSHATSDSWPESGNQNSMDLIMTTGREQQFESPISSTSGYQPDRGSQQGQDRRAYPPPSHQPRHGSAQLYATPPPSFGLSQQMQKRNPAGSSSSSTSRQSFQQPKRPKLGSSEGQVQTAAAQGQNVDAFDPMETDEPGIIHPQQAQSQGQLHGQRPSGSGYTQNQFGQSQRQHGNSPYFWHQQRMQQLIPHQVTSSSVMNPSSYIYQPNPLAHPTMLVPTEMARRQRQMIVSGLGSNDENFDHSRMYAAAWDRSTGLQGGVEGLNFGDVWRDPYYPAGRQQQQQQQQQQQRPIPPNRGLRPPRSDEESDE